MNLALAALLAAFPLALPLRAEDPQSGVIGAAIVEALEGDESALDATVVGLGYEAIPVVFGALSASSLPTLDAEGELSAVELSVDQVLLLEAAFTGFPDRDVAAFLRELAQRPLSATERTFAIRELGRVGTRRDLELLTALTLPEGVRGSRSRVPRPYCVGFQRSLASIHTRTPCSSIDVVALYRGVPLDLAAHVIWGLGETDSVSGLVLLVELLGELDDADPLILTEIARLGELLPHPLPEEVGFAVSMYLDAIELELLLLAIRAVEKIEVQNATARLIELTDHEIGPVAKAAVAALRASSGIDRGRGSKHWKEWYAKTQRWWQHEAPGLLRDIERGDDAARSRALLEASKWRFYRHEIAPVVVDTLKSPDQELVVLSCAVLGHLGSWIAVPELIELVGKSDGAVLQAAARALQRITGRDFGSDEEAWSELLRSHT